MFDFAAWATALINTWGYIGVFLVSLIGSASIIFPIPAFAVIFASGMFLDPLLVGIVAGIGSAIGETTGYALGRGSDYIIEKKWKKWIDIAKEYSHKRGIFFVILLFAATPLPDDIVGILSGAVKYPVKRFLLASLIGKLVLSIALAYAGASIGWMFGL